MAVPNLMNAQPVDTSDRLSKGITAGALAGPDLDEREHAFEDAISDGYFLKLAQEAEAQGVLIFQQSQHKQWERAYRAFRNQHFFGSKYDSPEYRARSKYFRPKTRTAVLRKLSEAAQAMFATGDIVSVAPENEADDWQTASAALKQQILNYRLSRVSRKNGVRWFQIAMGAMQTAQLTGLCVSKQSWRYREDPSGCRERSLEDRPDITLFPSENVLFDPNCDWLDPAQTSQYLMLRNPMSVDEIMMMIEEGIAAGNTVFLDVSREAIAARARNLGPADTVSTRTAREGGRDPKMQISGHFGRVWANEVFMQVRGKDFVYWTIDNQILLSKPIPVGDAYPAFDGERPVVIGYGALEAFRALPMSPVESWQQMQMEINDHTNLRLDHIKQVVSPPAKVVRGQKVDLTQVQRRAANGIVMVNKLDDVDWWQAPDVPQSAFVENNQLTSDFDSLAGIFDAGSVNTNRQLNETVGGMRLLANSVNPQAEFDLNIWIETWVEPVLWQLLKLEEMYESDVTVLAIAGQKAQLWEKFGINQITDDLLTKETSITVKVGVGASNLPQDKIQKFAMANSVVMQTLAPFIQNHVIQPPTPRLREIVETVFGAAGFKDGGDRFFDNLDAGPAHPPGPDPAAMADAQAKSQMAQVQMQRAQLDFQAKREALQQKREDAMAKLEAEHMKALAEIGKSYLDQTHQAATQGREHAHADHHKALDQQHGLIRDQINKQASMAQQAFNPPQMPQQGQSQPQGTPPAATSVLPGI